MDGVSAADVIGASFGEPDMTDVSFLYEVGDGANSVFDRDER